jgi:hypothetical protein
MLISAAKSTISTLAPVLIAGGELAIGRHGPVSRVRSCGCGVCLMLGIYFMRFRSYVRLIQAGGCAGIGSVAASNRQFCRRRFVLMVARQHHLLGDRPFRNGCPGRPAPVRAIFMPGFALSFAAAPIAGQTSARALGACAPLPRRDRRKHRDDGRALCSHLQWRRTRCPAFSETRASWPRARSFAHHFLWNFTGAGIIYSFGNVSGARQHRPRS